MFRGWYLVAMAIVVCSQAQVVLAATESEKQAVRNFLLARGEFPDGLTVADGIAVTFETYGEERQVGSLFVLKAQIEDTSGQVLKGRGVELLVLAGEQSVVPALLQWEGNNPDVRGKWNGTQVKFANLFLTRELPQNSRLAVVMRTEQGNNMFHVQTFPLASRPAHYQLVAPISHTALESNPPRARWTLSFTTDIPPKSLVSYYVRDEFGSESGMLTFSTLAGPPSRSLNIWDQPHRTWGEGCFTLVVGISKLRFDEDGVMLLSPSIVTAPFGSCQAAD